MTKRTIYAISLLLCAMGLLLSVSCGLMSVKDDEQKLSEKLMPQKEITVTTEPSKTKKAEENEEAKIYEDVSEYLKKKPKTIRGLYVYVFKTDPVSNTLIVNRKDDNAIFSISNAKLKGYKRFDQIKEGDKVFLQYKNGTLIVTEITRHIKEKTAATKKPKEEKKPTTVKIPANNDEKLKSGRLMHNVPKEMKVGINERIEVKISKDSIEDLTRDLKGRGIPQTNNIIVGDCVKVRLSGTENYFQINSKSSEEQVVRETGSTLWEWDVVPLHSGSPNINIKAMVVYETDHRTVPYDLTVFDSNIPVKINVSYTTKEFIKKNWNTIIPMIIGSGIIGWVLKRFRIFRKTSRQRRNP